MQEDLQPAPEFFKYFISEDLFYVPEGNKMVPSGSSVLPSVRTEENQKAAMAKNNAGSAQNSPAKELPFVAKGLNKKGVAVVVNMFEADFATITQHQMLMRMLAAIKLTADDVAFVNLTGQVNDLQEIAGNLNYENAILFLNPKHSLVAHHKLKQFQPMSVNGKYTIAAAELAALQSNDNQKRQLWTGLQAMFL